MVWKLIVPAYLAILTGLQPQYSEAAGIRLRNPNLWTRDTQGLTQHPNPQIATGKLW